MKENFADRIMYDFRPSNVLCVGRVVNFLVAALRERGIDSYGIDINAFEKLPGEFPKRYDILIAMDLSAEELRPVAENLCLYSNTILFIFDSVTPPPTEFLACVLAKNRFFNAINYCLPDHFSQRVMLFQKRDDIINTVFEYERFIRQHSETYSENQAELEYFQYRVTELQKANEALQNEIQNYSNLVAHERAQANEIKNAYLWVINSRTWKATKPVRLLLDVLKAKIFKPLLRLLRLTKKTLNFLRHNGLRLTLKKIKSKIFKNKTQGVPVIQAQINFSHEHSTLTGHPIDPIDIIAIDKNSIRLNLITDSLKSDSCAGGVATALILATLYANKMNCELRIITRTENISPLNYQAIMRVNGITPAKKISFYSDYDRFIREIDYRLDVGPADIFLATSWWSALAAKKTSIRDRIFYIIQEVETFFYNYGSERLLCEQVMKSGNIDFLINSSFLYEYFREHEPNITNNGIYFEPAFSKTLYKAPTFREKKKFKLFFYARPNNPRNLYHVGVNFLKQAIDTGILNSQEWDIYCAGQEAPIIEFSDGSKSINLGRLSWSDYAKFLSDIDLGLCLMYTPHPSYQPFNVACSGGVVLSNKMLNKNSFGMCENVILADLDEKLFLEAFRSAVSLAKNPEQRKRNFESNTIPRDWEATLSETLKYMEAKSRDV